MLHSREAKSESERLAGAGDVHSQPDGDRHVTADSYGDPQRRWRSIGSYGMRPRQIVSKDPGQRRRHCGVPFTAPIASLAIPTVNEGDYRGTVSVDGSGSPLSVAEFALPGEDVCLTGEDGSSSDRAQMKTIACPRIHSLLPTVRHGHG